MCKTKTWNTLHGNTRFFLAIRHPYVIAEASRPHVKIRKRTNRGRVVKSGTPEGPPAREISHPLKCGSSSIVSRFGMTISAMVAVAAYRTYAENNGGSPHRAGGATITGKAVGKSSIGCNRAKAFVFHVGINIELISEAKRMRCYLFMYVRWQCYRFHGQSLTR